MILIDTQKEEFTKLKDIRIFEKLDNEQRYNGDLLVIGLGGMGSQVVCDMKGMLMGEITPDDNIQYLKPGWYRSECNGDYQYLSPESGKSSGKRHQGESGASESCELDA